MKASALDRGCSLAALETRLGPYQPPKVKERPRPPKRPYQAKPLTRHPATSKLWRQYAQIKKPGFLQRSLKLTNWKYYLMADAHKDPLALAIILTYKEMLHMLDEATTIQRRQYRPPKAASPALETWFKGSTWKPPQAPWLKGRVDDMDLRVDEAGRALFPFRDGKGHIWAVRAIDEAGRSCDVGDVAARPDLSHAIDPGRELRGKRYDGPVTLTSDCLTAAVLHQESGKPVVVVASDRALPVQAAALRRRHPDAEIVVATPARSPMAEKAATASQGRLAVVDAPQGLASLISWLVGKGRIVAVDPGQVRAMGAFAVDALSLEEALDSRPGGKAKTPSPEKGGGIGR